MGVALDSTSTHLYIADFTNNAVQVLNLINNQTTTFLNALNGLQPLTRGRVGDHDGAAPQRPCPAPEAASARDARQPGPGPRHRTPVTSMSLGGHQAMSPRLDIPV